jgi:hypothetical protein
MSGTVVADQFNGNGDCGAWVVGAENQELYGYVAFGHPGDKYAYVISARSIFRQISAEVSDYVTICASGPTFKFPFSARNHRQNQTHQGRWSRQRDPQENIHHGYASPQMPPYGNPWGYPGVYPQTFQPYTEPPTARDNPGERISTSPSPAPNAGTTAEEAIARLEKLILDDRLEREAKEAARNAAIESEAAEKAAREVQLAHDRKIAQEAAAIARADAEVRAAQDAALAKEKAEAAAQAAAAESQARIARLEAVKEAELRSASGRLKKRSNCVLQ